MSLEQARSNYMLGIAILIMLSVPLLIADEKLKGMKDDKDYKRKLRLRNEYILAVAFLSCVVTVVQTLIGVSNITSLMLLQTAIFFGTIGFDLGNQAKVSLAVTIITALTFVAK